MEYVAPHMASPTENRTKWSPSLLQALHFNKWSLFAFPVTTYTIDSHCSWTQSNLAKNWYSAAGSYILQDWREGRLVAESVKHLTWFRLRSWSRDCEIEPHIRLCPRSGACLIFSLSFFLSPFSLSLFPFLLPSLSWKNKKDGRRKILRKKIHQPLESHRLASIWPGATDLTLSGPQFLLL